MIRPHTVRRWRVGLAAAAVLAAYCISIYIVFLWTAKAALSSTLRVPLAVFAVQTVFLGILSVGVCVIKFRRQQRLARAAGYQDAIQRLLAANVAEEHPSLKVEPAWLEDPDCLAFNLEIMLLCTRGEARQRLTRLVSEVGLTSHWLRDSRGSNVARRGAAVRRLGLLENDAILERLSGMIGNSDPAVRVAVYRALLKMGCRNEDLEKVFHAVLDEPLLIRALLNNDLGRHATELAARALPEALKTPDPERLARLLDMVVAWRRMVSLPGLRSLLHSANPAIQQRMLALLPYLLDEPDPEERILMQTAKLAAVLSGLESGEELVTTAAAAASGRLKLEAAIPLLIRGLKDGRRLIVRSSAEALMDMGTVGKSILETQIKAFSGFTASAMLEALDRPVARQRAGGSR